MCIRDSFFSLTLLEMRAFLASFGIGSVKTSVGRDSRGNQFFLEKENGKLKRLVEYHGENSLGDVSPLWRSWLHGKRNSIPSTKELADETQKHQLYMRRVEEFKQADAKLRLQELAEQESRKSDSSDFSPSQFFQKQQNNDTLDDDFLRDEPKNSNEQGPKYDYWDPNKKG
eukprot:TRINITY_DN1569_c0_g1_i1.p1 TRINITY_DN1569_c0_g1~~TRINITY_DN1569_c0_g1_i1.p1  ORF type:complete len:171 (+),score=47.26 TRINITY_DN1569_c0_g1_i1:54-566(+)